MTFDDFIEALCAAGWRAQGDAQHAGAKALWLTLDVPSSEQRMFWRHNENMSVLRSVCAKAKAQGRQHVPLATVEILARDVSDESPSGPTSSSS